MRPNNEWTNKYVTQKNNDCPQNPTSGEVISALCATNGYFRGNAETWRRGFTLDWVADQDKMILCVLICLSVIPFCVHSQINRGRRTNSQPGQSTTFPGRASGSSKPDKNMDYEGILPKGVGRTCLWMSIREGVKQWEEIEAIRRRTPLAPPPPPPFNGTF